MFTKKDAKVQKAQVLNEIKRDLNTLLIASRVSLKLLLPTGAPAHVLDLQEMAQRKLEGLMAQIDRQYKIEA
jgi:hypothetical protein